MARRPGAAQEWNRTSRDAFYLELTRTGRPWKKTCVHLSVELAGETNTPVVATNDVRFLAREDFWAHETRVAIGEGKALDDPRRERRYSEEQYLKTPRRWPSCSRISPRRWRTAS